MGRDRLGGEGAAHPAGAESAGLSRRPPPSKKAVAAQIAAFTAGKALVPPCETDDLYQRWQDLVQMTDPAGRDAQVRQIGNDTCEHCAILPLFDGGIAVVVDPKVIDAWAFSGWDGGDIGHTWLITACKQARPCVQ